VISIHQQIRWIEHELRIRVLEERTCHSGEYDERKDWDMRVFEAILLTLKAVAQKKSTRKRRDGVRR
jgi:hypothetical protein